MKRIAKKLAMQLYEDTRKQFPAIRFINIQNHPEQAGRYWINVAGDMSEDEEEEMRMFVGKIATDILINEGYSFAVMLDNTLVH
jgi:hypothetical protein